jgi:thiol-disulfide isomerase/thioredoxin
VGVNLGRRAVVSGGATLLAGLGGRNSARGEAVDLHAPSEIVAVSPPGVLPALTFSGLDGTAVGLQAFRGRPVVLNFWATWCVPCVAELPELDKLAAAGDIAVLAVSADRRGADAVRPFLAKHPVRTLTVLLDPGSDAVHAAGVVGFPTTLVLDGLGRVRGRFEGPAAWGSAGDTVRKLAG